MKVDSISRKLSRFITRTHYNGLLLYLQFLIGSPQSCFLWVLVVCDSVREQLYNRLKEKEMILIAIWKLSRCSLDIHWRTTAILIFNLSSLHFKGAFRAVGENSDTNRWFRIDPKGRKAVDSQRLSSFISNEISFFYRLIETADIREFQRPFLWRSIEDNKLTTAISQNDSFHIKSLLRKILRDSRWPFGSREESWPSILDSNLRPLVSISRRIDSKKHADEGNPTARPQRSLLRKVLSVRPTAVTFRDLFTENHRGPTWEK